MTQLLRDIPGYGGRYKVTDLGEVRSYWWRGQPMKNGKYRVLKAFTHHADKSRRRYVKLTQSDGHSELVPVINLMVQTWSNGPPPGKVAYHKNGNLSDNSIYNIGFITRQDLGRRTGAASRRRPVAKIALSGQVVAHYSSARTAAKENHMSYQTVLDRCNDKVKQPYALDGHTYIFDD